MKFVKGDKVEHRNRGKGTVVGYDPLDDSCVIVDFDLDSDAKGETLGVTESLLIKLTA
jgi:hypothetical protein